MEIKVCSECKVNPQFSSVDEFGLVYSCECPNCRKHTQNVLCPSATICNPNIDEETKNRLIEEWNSKN
ncbi:hypothetical protein G8S21_04675 [Clostridium botulinum C]|uniref:hypothetical protein n=1 Tax=Clostridium botulinum TaxID=1491 RepID=UPI001E322421|nr:hypothetical protein [Clostridium botulinum]MCD3245243.1 hypothetical protein [Clostridium botulinum C]MCD3261622.1 hypothetical protein [Clostridium botulinum C]